MLFLHRIKVVEQQSLGLIALGPRDGQRNDGVLADDQRAFLAVGFEIPQPPCLRANGRDLQIHTPAVEQLVGAITRFGRAAFEVAERSSQACHRGTFSIQERRCTPKIPTLIRDFVGSRRRAVETKTGQKAGLEGFQSIQRNAVELDVVRRQESNRAPLAQQNKAFR